VLDADIRQFEWAGDVLRVQELQISDHVSRAHDVLAMAGETAECG
jgi:hypothetical protein